MKKQCFKCFKIKPLSYFYKHFEMKDGYLNKCKECAKQDSKNNEKNYFSSVLSYDKTEKGVIRVIYKTQKSNSKRRNHPCPSYSKEWLTLWLYDNNFKKFYNEWVDSNYLKSEKPSIDRIDDYKPYTKNNIRLVKWKDNKDKQTTDILLGRSTSGERCRPVIQYDSSGKFLAEYVSFNSAKRINGYSMERSLKSGRIDRKGFKWSYKNGNTR